MRVATSAQIAELDRRATAEYGISTAVLMDRAGQRVVEVVGNHLRDRGGRRVLVLAGKGNNGGDGLVAARYLRSAGFQVAAYIVVDEQEYQGEARLALEAARDAGVSMTPVARASASDLEKSMAATDVIVDALFGTGFRGSVTGDAATLIELANQTGTPIVAVDIPSGLHADTGRSEGPCIQATATVTLGLPKVGLLVHPGASMAGVIYVADIGYPSTLADDPAISTHLVTAEMVRSLVPLRAPDAHKGTYGRVLVIAGSVGFTGAAVLTTLGALRTGAGLVTVGVPHSVYPIVAAKVTEGMPTPLADAAGTIAPQARDRIAELAANSDAIAVGPGLSRSDGVWAVVEGLLQGDRPLVIDADALNVLSGRAQVLRQSRAPVVITPHPGELGRLVNRSAAEIQIDRLGAARAAAAQFRCVVLLKGARTVAATPDGQAYIVPTGNPGMATGGMGDVLTGAIAALIGQGRQLAESAYGGAYLHGLAADLIAEARGQVGMLASEVADHLPVAIRRVQMGEQRDLIIELRDR